MHFLNFLLVFIGLWKKNKEREAHEEEEEKAHEEEEEKAQIRPDGVVDEVTTRSQKLMAARRLLRGPRRGREEEMTGC